jgi:hypothetical protein
MEGVGKWERVHIERGEGTEQGREELRLENKDRKAYRGETGGRQLGSPRADLLSPVLCVCMRDNLVETQNLQEVDSYIQGT